MLSEPGYPNGGVPQGTVSGPKLFLVQINDLNTPCPLYKYIDDGTMFEICTSGSASRLQDSANDVAQWSKENDMRLNPKKTKEMLISFAREPTHVNSVPNINNDGVDIERVTQAKVLGVTVSSNLTWNAHVDNIVTKARKQVYILYQLKRAGICQCDMVKIYLSVIVLYLNMHIQYGIQVCLNIYHAASKQCRKGP